MIVKFVLYCYAEAKTLFLGSVEIDDLEEKEYSVIKEYIVTANTKYKDILCSIKFYGIQMFVYLVLCSIATTKFINIGYDSMGIKLMFIFFIISIIVAYFIRFIQYRKKAFTYEFIFEIFIYLIVSLFCLNITTSRTGDNGKITLNYVHNNISINVDCKSGPKYSEVLVNDNVIDKQNYREEDLSFYSEVYSDNDNYYTNKKTGEQVSNLEKNMR